MASSPSLPSHALAVDMSLIHHENSPWLQLDILLIGYKATPRLQLQSYKTPQPEILTQSSPWPKVPS